MERVSNLDLITLKEKEHGFGMINTTHRHLLKEYIKN